MKKILLALAMFAMYLTGCSVTTHQLVVAHDHEINPDFYSEITPISATEDGACAITEFYDSNLKNYDNIVDIQAEQTRTTMGFSVLVISDEITCDYRAFGVKYKDGSKIQKSEGKKEDEKKPETDESLLEHRTDGTDAFDTLYIGCEKFPQQFTVNLSSGGVM